MDKTCDMIRTDEHIKVMFSDGRETVHKRTIYKDGNGDKYIYNQRRFWDLEYFMANHNIVQ